MSISGDFLCLAMGQRDLATQGTGCMHNRCWRLGKSQRWRILFGDKQGFLVFNGDGTMSQFVDHRVGAFQK